MNFRKIFSAVILSAVALPNLVGHAANNQAPAITGPRSHAARLEYSALLYKASVEAYKKQGPEAFFEATTGIFNAEDRTFVLSLMRGLPEFPTFQQKGETLEIGYVNNTKITVQIEDRRAGKFWVNGKSIKINYDAPFKESYSKLKAHVDANKVAQAGVGGMVQICDVTFSYMQKLVMPDAHAGAGIVLGILGALGLGFVVYNVGKEGNIKDGLSESGRKISDIFQKGKDKTKEAFGGIKDGSERAWDGDRRKNRENDKVADEDHHNDGHHGNNRKGVEGEGH